MGIQCGSYHVDGSSNGKGVNNDEITKGDKTVNIPSWIILVGVLALDNIVVNVCKTSAAKKLLDVTEKKES